MKIFAMAASVRTGSYNRKLIEVASSMAREAGAEVDLGDFREFAMPLYDGDLEKAEGMPEGALALHDRIKEADGLMIASPEYNHSIPGSLKNAIDWVSRARPGVFNGKSGLLLAAAPGALGGIRGLMQLRVPLEAVGMHLYPATYALPSAAGAFDAEGNIADEARAARLEKLIGGFLETTRKLTMVPTV